MTRSRSYIAMPPGATIKEQLEDRGMSQKEFASRMEMSEKHISHLINGDVQLTPDVAYRLELVLGLPANFWSSLEAIYREKIAKANAENALDADKEIAKKFPYQEMANNGWLPDTRKIEERVINLRKYFEVVQLKCLTNDKLIPNIVYRQLSITKKSDYALIAWAQRARIEARKISTEPINLKELAAQLPYIKEMTKEDPCEFCQKLIQVLSKCGIALVFLPHMSGSFLHGATFYDNNKIVIGLTLRGKDADKFWFSLFHEFGHILLGHLNKATELDKDDEIAADQFAKDTLISQKDFKMFIKQGIFTEESICAFSKQINIDPGITVGRLQKEGYIEFSWYNTLKVKYELTS